MVAKTPLPPASIAQWPAVTTRLPDSELTTVAEQEKLPTPGKVPTSLPCTRFGYLPVFRTQTLFSAPPVAAAGSGATVRTAPAVPPLASTTSGSAFAIRSGVQ